MLPELKYPWEMLLPLSSYLLSAVEKGLSKAIFRPETSSIQVYATAKAQNCINPESLNM